MSEKSEISSLFGASKIVKIKDAEVEIKEILVGDIPKILGIMTLFSEKKSKSNADKIKQILNENFDDCISLIESTTSLSSSDIKKLKIGVLLEILSEILKENASFFQEEVLPQFNKLTEDLGGLSKSKGL